MNEHYIQIFEAILEELANYHGAALRRLAEEAGVSLPCLYNWQTYPPITPQLRTFVGVATAMGYEVRLVRKRRHLKAVA